MLSKFSYTKPAPPAKGSRQKEISLDNMPKADNELFELLKETRLAIARAQHMPPYIVFSDRVLDVIARSLPTSREEFAALYGIGEKKTEMYWRPFTATVKQFLEKHPQ